jgi:hypothetical protein
MRRGCDRDSGDYRTALGRFVSADLLQVATGLIGDLMH